MGSTLIIITDGACSGNPGPGGWAALRSFDDGRTQPLQNGETDTTNNRMELRAAIEGLRAAPPEAEVELEIDSAYVHNNAQGSLARWQREGWQTRGGGAVKNQDLWQELAALLATRTVRWVVVRGHRGHQRNEYVDQAARQEVARAARNVPATPAVTASKDVSDGRVYLSLVDGVCARHTTWDGCKRRTHTVSGARFRRCDTRVEQMTTVRDWAYLKRRLQARRRCDSAVH